MKLEEIPVITYEFYCIIACIRGSQDHPQVCDSLEGLKGPRKAVILMSTVYYSKKIKISKEKGSSLVCGSGCPIPVDWCRQGLVLPAILLMTWASCYQPGKSPEAWCPGTVL